MTRLEQLRADEKRIVVVRRIVRAFCQRHRIVGETDEVLGNVLLAITKRYPHTPISELDMPLLNTVAYRHAILYHRWKYDTEPNMSINDSAVDFLWGKDDTAQKDARVFIESRMKYLKPKHQWIVVRLMEGASSSDIYGELGCSRIYYGYVRVGIFAVLRGDTNKYKDSHPRRVRKVA